jgi:transcriptional regulator with XRE-family HTH domain
MEPTITFQNNLRDIRMSLGMRQADVADLLGHASADRISHWEKGSALPGIINLFKLSIIYGVRPEHIYADLHKSLTHGLQHKNGQKSALSEDLGSSPSLVQKDDTKRVLETH